MKSTTTQIVANMKKNPSHDRVSFTVRKEELNPVATNLFKRVARLIAFARMQVAKTSLGINHDPGPIPKLKKAKYNPRPIIVKAVLELLSPAT